MSLTGIVEITTPVKESVSTTDVPSAKKRTIPSTERPLLKHKQEENMSSEPYDSNSKPIEPQQLPHPLLEPTAILSYASK